MSGVGELSQKWGSSCCHKPTTQANEETSSNKHAEILSCSLYHCTDNDGNGADENGNTASEPIRTPRSER